MTVLLPEPKMLLTENKTRGNKMNHNHEEELRYKIKSQKRLFDLTKTDYSRGVLMGLIEAYAVVKNITWTDAYNEFFN